MESGAKPKPPVLLIAVDQIEELFLAEAQSGARPFLAFFQDLLLTDAPAAIAIFTIRSESYERLQVASEFSDIPQETFSLPPMLKGAYAEVIKGPMQRLEGTERTIKIDDALVDALLGDIETGGAKDALPLLTFTLERLYTEYYAGGNLKLEHYNALGRVQLRGGSRITSAGNLRAADRYGIPREHRDLIFGFRVARTLTQ